MGVSHLQVDAQGIITYGSALLERFLLLRDSTSHAQTMFGSGSLRGRRYC